MSSDQKYRILDRLDSGGMAEIYRAEAELIRGFKKTVAVKRILPHLTKNKKFVAMFLDEARLSLYLDHANIVQVFDIGRSGETYFIVMEYVEGVNLRSLVRTQTESSKILPMGQSIFLAMEVCKGLGYAHDLVNPEDGRPMQIVHRDISPPNILLSRNGEVKLVDFGLAKAASQLEETDPGVVKGKFSYLSPEAAAGEEVDHRADIFACGIILFELLTGSRLFCGESDYQTVELVRNAKIPPPRSINSNILPDLEDITLRALARRPADRYQHAYEVQEELAQVLFDRGLRVTSRDIARSVAHCLGQTGGTRSVSKKKPSAAIDTLISEEIVKFTSLDQTELTQHAGVMPLSPDTHSMGSGPLDPKEFQDPQIWPVNRTYNQPDRSLSGENPVPEITSLEEVLEGTNYTVEDTYHITDLPRESKVSTVARVFPQPGENSHGGPSGRQKRPRRPGLIAAGALALITFLTGSAFALHFYKVINFSSIINLIKNL